MKALSSAIIVLAGVICISAAMIAMAINRSANGLAVPVVVGSIVLLLMGLNGWLSDRKSEP